MMMVSVFASGLTLEILLDLRIVLLRG